MPELDAIRGLAVLMVLTYHGLFWSYPVDRASGAVRLLLQVTQPGWLGVDLFFVLSGFLITGILLDARDRTDYYGRFYKRRALRILPAYFACIAGLLILGYIHWPFAVLSAFFCANIATIFNVATEYGPFWSLAVEEHFYLAWPAAVRNVSRRSLLGLALAVIVVSPLFRLWGFHNGYAGGLYGYTLFRLDGLALGAVLAIVLREEWLTKPRLLKAIVIVTALAFVLLGAGAPYGILTRNMPLGAALQFTPWSLLFAALIAGTLLVGSSRYASLVQSRALRFAGEISYGLYLVHLVVFSAMDRIATRHGVLWNATGTPLGVVLTRFGVCAGLSVLIAFFSRRTFEAYFLRLKEKGTEAPIVVPQPELEPTST